MPADRLEQRRRARRGDGVRGARRRRHRRAPSATSSDAAQGALPEPRRRRYLETLALAGLAMARREGDFEAALQAADALLAEAARHAGGPQDARAGARTRDARGDRAVGPPPRPRAGRSCARRSRSPARTGSISSRCRRSAISRCWSDGRMARPTSSGHGRQAIELAADRGWSRSRRRRARTPALALHAFSDLRPDDAALHLEQARVAARAAATPPAGLRDRAPRCAHASTRPARRVRRCARSTTSRPSTATVGRRCAVERASLACDARPPAGGERGPGGRGGDARAGRGRAVGRGRHLLGAPARSPGATRPRRSKRSSASSPPSPSSAVGRVERASLLAIAYDEAGEPRRRSARSSRRSPWPRRTAIAGRSSRLGRRMEDLLRTADPRGHRAPRDRRRAAGHVRGPRAGRTPRQPAARAAVRPRAGHPALPADDALQPRDRRRVVRHDQHRQDAPAQRSTASSMSPGGATPSTAPATYGS